jgi:hypothetical protein
MVIRVARVDRTINPEAPQRVLSPLLMALAGRRTDLGALAPYCVMSGMILRNIDRRFHGRSKSFM